MGIELKIIGIDPSSKLHGVALYENKKLIMLKNMDDYELIDLAKTCDIVSMENVIANKFVYGRNSKYKKTISNKIAISVGMNMQAQVTLMRAFDHYEIPYILHKPSKNNFADDKNKFERLTGWDKRSNRDTRSAAYFGLIAI